jgi:hypothetical protein
MRVASSSVRAPQNRGKGPADEDDVDKELQYDTTSGDGDDDDNVHQWEYTGHEEMGPSQLHVAPIGTQGNYTQAEQQVPILARHVGVHLSRTTLFPPNRLTIQVLHLKTRNYFNTNHISLIILIIQK